MQKKMDFSAKNRINSIVGCIYTGLDACIRRTYRCIRQRVQPFAENTFFAYVRQDATVLSGELANEENQGGVRRYWIFPQKKSPEGLIFDSFTAHLRLIPATIPRPSRDHLTTITDVTIFKRIFHIMHYYEKSRYEKSRNRNSLQRYNKKSTYARGMPIFCVNLLIP